MPRPLTAEYKLKLRRYWQSQYTLRKAGTKLGISPGTVHRYYKLFKSEEAKRSGGHERARTRKN